MHSLRWNRCVVQESRAASSSTSSTELDAGVAGHFGLPSSKAGQDCTDTKRLTMLHSCPAHAEGAHVGDVLHDVDVDGGARVVHAVRRQARVRLERHDDDAGRADANAHLHAHAKVLLVATTCLGCRFLGMSHCCGPPQNARQHEWAAGRSRCMLQELCSRPGRHVLQSALVR
jgi:hypothetical protein